jgi:hypothetical protein
VLLSNTSITHIEFIERNFPVLGYMHERVTSFSVGAMKPDHRIFNAALKAAGCPLKNVSIRMILNPTPAQPANWGSIHTRSPRLNC